MLIFASISTKKHFIMHKFYLVLLVITYSLNVFSQKVQQNIKPINSLNQHFNFNNKIKNKKLKKLVKPTKLDNYTGYNLFQNRYSSDSCGVDTIQYPLLGKATAIDANTMNVPSEFSGYAQYYDAPQPIKVHGFCFYAWVNSNNPSDTAIVTCTLFQALADSTPGTILATKDVTVDITYSSTDLEVIKYCVSFDSAIVVNSPYLVALETSTSLPLGVISNSSSNADGAGEELGFWKWETDQTWYRTNEFFVWDIDYVFHPIVEYEFIANFNMSSDSVCFNDTVVFNGNTSPILWNRMYNQDTLNTILWNFDNGQTSTLINDSSIYNQSGNYTINLTQTINGWSTNCNYTISKTLVVDTIPNAAFSWSGGSGGNVAFTNLSSGYDSVFWEFGDGIGTSSQINPSYLYSSYQNLVNDTMTVKLIVYNNCGTDSSIQDVYLTPTGIKNYLKESISIYPNPVKESLYIYNKLNKHITVKLTDVSGKLISKFIIGSGKYMYAMNKLQLGMYFLTLSDNNTVTVLKVLKQ